MSRVGESEYDRIIDETAAALAMTLRALGDDRRVYVVAYPTTETENGRVMIDASDEPITHGGRIVAPGTGPAASWNHIAYSAQRGLLWHALRREPIMPIHPVGPPAAAH